MTEGPRVNFVMRETLFEIYTWILCLSCLHEKQNPYIYILSKLSRFGFEISIFKYTTGGIQNSRGSSRLVHVRHLCLFMEKWMSKFY